jgi:hypothetical protein
VGLFLCQPQSQKIILSTIPSYSIVADSSEATGLKWAAASGGGKVLQVVQVTYDTSTTIASESFTDTGLTATITPTLSTSKILVQYLQTGKANRSGNQLGVAQKLLRGSTDIYNTAGSGFTWFLNNDPIEVYSQYAGLYLDSPATTSATTYKTQAKCQASTVPNASITYQISGATSVMILMEIGV